MKEKEDLFDKILKKYGVQKNQKKAILEMLYYDTPDGKIHNFYYREDDTEYEKLDNEILKICENPEEYSYNVKKEENSINNVYDKTMRMALDEKKNAVKIINIALNGGATITEEKIEKYNSSFVSSNLENSEADVVYKLKDKNVFFLLEHQSKVDNVMAYRIAKYQFEIIDSVIKDTKGKYKNKSYKFPQVIPIVIYIGKGKWTAKQCFEEMQINWGKDTPKGFSNYLFVDVNQINNSELLEDNTTITKVMLMQKAKTEEEFNTYWEEIENELEINKRKYTNEQIEFVRNVITSIAMTKYDRKDIRKILERYQKLGGKENMMVVVENLRKDRERAVKKSRMEGIREGESKMMGVIENLKEDRERAVKKSRMEGIKEGESKMMGVIENLKEDRERAVKKSRMEGIREGKIEEKIEIAKKMLEVNVDIELVSKATGISIDELEKIK